MQGRIDMRLVDMSKNVTVNIETMMTGNIMITGIRRKNADYLEKYLILIDINVSVLHEAQ